jgi:hypothetical protein
MVIIARIVVNAIRNQDMAACDVFWKSTGTQRVTTASAANVGNPKGFISASTLFIEETRRLINETLASSTNPNDPFDTEMDNLCVRTLRIVHTSTIIAAIAISIVHLAVS